MFDHVDFGKLNKIRANWKCPNCGRHPLKNCIVADGGSARCSDNNCNTMFHHCPQRGTIFSGHILESKCSCWFY